MRPSQRPIQIKDRENNEKMINKISINRFIGRFLWFKQTISLILFLYKVYLKIDYDCFKYVLTFILNISVTRSAIGWVDGREVNSLPVMRFWKISYNMFYNIFNSNSIVFQADTVGCCGGL